MIRLRKNILAFSIIPQILLVKWLGSHHLWIERYYSEGLYLWISKCSRILLGWIPFSMGDLIYIALGIWAIVYLIKHRNQIRNNKKVFVRDIFIGLSLFYFVFNLLWGLNYYRLPMGEKLGLQTTYTQPELEEVTLALLHKTNALQLEIVGDSTNMVKVPYSKKEVLSKIPEGYQTLAKIYPDFAYKHTSLKASLLSWPLTYMGYAGYLNPFTNEAQVNDMMPLSRFPFVCSHEVGHQVGYAAEDQTNFIGFLAASHHPDLYFKYSAYSAALSYCLFELRRTDEQVFETTMLQLNEGVRKNYREISAFWDAHETPIEPVFKSMFNAFLKANSQEKGIKSYNDMVGLLIGYYHQQGNSF